MEWGEDDCRTQPEDSPQAGKLNRQIFWKPSQTRFDFIYEMKPVQKSYKNPLERWEQKGTSLRNIFSWVRIMQYLRIISCGLNSKWYFVLRRNW